MIVWTESGLGMIDNTGLGLAPPAIPKIAQSVLTFFKTNLPLIITNLSKQQPVKIPIEGRTGTLTPDQVRQWLELFCQYGLLPAENCRVQPPPTSPPQPPTEEPWYKKINPETWLLAGAFLLSVLLILKMR